MKCGNSKGGSSKSRGGGQSIEIKKEKARQTAAINDNIVTLRSAIFTPTGADKDVTQGIAPAFMKYDRNGLDLTIEFSPRLSRKEFEWAFDIVKDNMEDRYDASGYGWDDEDKRRELSEDGTRFLLVRERGATTDGKPGDLVAFAHFRFSVQGDVLDQMAGEPSLFLWDLHVEEDKQRKGLGKHLLTVLELIARREKMNFLCVPIQLHDEISLSWISQARGYAPDTILKELMQFDAEMEGFEVFSKSLAPPAPKVSTETTVMSFATPTKVASGKAPALSPSGVDEAVDDAVGADAEEDDDADNEIRLEDLNEHDIINGLKAMFIEKNGRDPTEEEAQRWLVEIRSAKAADAAEAATQAKINKSTYDV